MVLQKVVTPVKTGVQCLCKCLKFLDSGLRRNDEKQKIWTFCGAIKVDRPAKSPDAAPELHPQLLRRTFSTPHSFGIARLACGLFANLSQKMLILVNPAQAGIK